MFKINQCFNDKCLCDGDMKKCAYALLSLDGKCLYLDSESSCCNGLAKRAFQAHVDNGMQSGKN